MCNFKIGQKVICIDAAPRLLPSTLVKGKIYTIKGFVGDAAVLLEEIESNGWSKGYWVDRFKPIQYDNISSELANKFKEIIEICDTPVKELENA